MLAAAKEETFAPLGSGEEIFSLAAARGLLGTHVEGKTETLSKTRVWGFGEKMLPDIRATWQLSGNTRWGCENSSWKTAVGSALDANGNTLADAQGRSFTWDFENRLVQAVVPGANGGTTTFKYDPFGKRIEKLSPNATSIFLYDGVDLIETINGSGSEIANYTRTRKIDETLAELRGSTVDYYQTDGLRSTTSLSSSSGTVASTYTYDSFGNITNFTGTLRNPFQYTGREYDSETNLYFYRARYYDPVAGRFVNEDPIRFKGGNNFYTYVLNDPVILRDPTGLCGCPERDSCYAEARQNLSLELMACGLVCLVQPELCPECIAGAGAVYSLELLICRFNRPC